MTRSAKRCSAPHVQGRRAITSASGSWRARALQPRAPRRISCGLLPGRLRRAPRRSASFLPRRIPAQASSYREHSEMRTAHSLIAIGGILGAVTVLAAGCRDYVADYYTPLIDPKL